MIVKFPDDRIGHEMEIHNDLKSLQAIVGGNIETVTIADGSDRIVLIMNEDGKYMLLRENFWMPIGGRWDLIVGPVIICGVSGEEFADVPIDLNAWQRLLESWRD